MAIAAGTGTTIIDHVLPAQNSRTGQWVRDGILVILGSLFMALSARAQVSLFFTPIPITLQTLVVMLIAASYGSKRGTLAMLLYLAEGASGLPVFSKGGGYTYLIFSPTAGYLWAFPVAAWVMGGLCECGFDRSYLTSVLAMIPGSLIMLGTGTLWLAVATAIIKQTSFNLATAFALGFAPFIAGEIAKMLVAAALLPTAWLLVRRVRFGKK